MTLCFFRITFIKKLIRGNLFAILSFRNFRPLILFQAFFFEGSRDLGGGGKIAKGVGPKMKSTYARGAEFNETLNLTGYCIGSEK